MAKTPEKSSLIGVVDALFMDLLKESGGSKVSSDTPAGWPDETSERSEPSDAIDFGSRLKLLEVAVKWMGVRGRLPDEDQGDAFGALRERYGRTGSSSARAAASKDGNGNGAGS